MNGTSALLRPFAEALAPLSAQVLELPMHRRLGYEAVSRLARSHLDGPEPAVLVAESFSGPAAIRVAADPPASLRALVLVATFASPPVPGPPGWAVAESFFRGSLTRRAIRHLLLDPGAPSAMVLAVEAAVGEISPRVLADRLRQVLAVDATDELRRVRVPILHIEPTRDRLLWRRGALARIRPDIQHEPIDAPHLVLQRRAPESARLVQRFVRNVAPEGARFLAGRLTGPEVLRVPVRALGEVEAQLA